MDRFGIAKARYGFVLGCYGIVNNRYRLAQDRDGVVAELFDIACGPIGINIEP